MLTLLEAIQQRRSIRQYDPEKPVSNEMVNQILEAGRLAPSAINRQPWRFIIVRDAATKKKMAELCLNQKMIEVAPVVIACFAELNSYSDETKKKRIKELDLLKYKQYMSKEIIDYLNQEEKRSWDEVKMAAVANTFIAIEHMVLMATVLDLGTCWVGGFEDASAFNKLFDLPDNFVTAAILPLGYPAGDVPTARPRLSLKDLILKEI